jgi:hypothetical protein
MSIAAYFALLVCACYAGLTWSTAYQQGAHLLMSERSAVECSAQSAACLDDDVVAPWCVSSSPMLHGGDRVTCSILQLLL